MVLLSRRVDCSGFWRASMEFPMFSTWRWTLGNFGTGVRNTMTVVLSLGNGYLLWLIPFLSFSLLTLPAGAYFPDPAQEFLR